MKKRVLMFGWEFPPYHSGGLGVACLGLTRALSNIGLDVLFVMPKKLDIQTQWARMIFADIEGVESVAINSILRPYVTSKSYVVRGDRSVISIYGQDLMSEVLRYASLGAGIARREQFDVIHAHDWLSFGAGMEAKRVSGKPLIVHVHATEFDRCGGSAGVNPDVYRIEKEGMEYADRVIAVSELTKGIIVREYGIPEEKVRVIYNGIDESTTPAKGSGALPRLRALKARGYKMVLFIGRVTLQKGPDYFLRVAKRVAEHDPKVLFILSGSGDMENQMMNLAAELGIAGQVFFTGFLEGEERHEVYSVADLFVMPSVSEPFGLTALEAMKLGTPVLMSKQSGVSEVVKHALKVDFWDVEEMANQILSVVGHPGLRQTLSENASREADRLTWTDAALKVNTIVQDLTQ